MKKSYIKILLLIISMSSYSYADFSTRLSFGLPYTASVSNAQLETIGSYELSAEYLVDPIDNFSFGFGISWINPADFSDSSAKAALSSNPIQYAVPLYGVAIFNFSQAGEYNSYLIGRAGFTQITENGGSKAENLSSGLFFSLGVGTYYNDFYAELTYDINQGSYNYPDGNGNLIGKELDYNRVTIRFGYKFNFVTETGAAENVEKGYINKGEKREYDSLEVYDEDGKIEEKIGDRKDITDYEIIE